MAEIIPPHPKKFYGRWLGFNATAVVAMNEKYKDAESNGSLRIEVQKDPTARTIEKSILFRFHSSPASIRSLLGYCFSGLW